MSWRVQLLPQGVKDFAQRRILSLSDGGITFVFISEIHVAGTEWSLPRTLGVLGRAQGGVVRCGALQGSNKLWLKVGLQLFTSFPVSFLLLFWLFI